MPRVLYWYATGVLLLVVAYFAAPIARAGLVGAVGLWAVAAIEYGIGRLRPQRAGGWHMLGVAVALLAIGDVTSLLVGVPSVAPLPYPGVSEVFYLAAYLPLTVALLWLGRPLTRYRDETSLLDAVTITLAGSLVVWILVVTPELEAQRLTARGYIDAIGAWVGFIGVFAVSVRVALSWRRNVSIAVLTVAVIIFLVSEILSGQELVRGSGGGRAELGYVAFTVLCGAAALHPSMRDLASPAQTRYTLGPWRLAIVGAVMLVGPTALLVETSAGVVRSGYAIATISGLVSLLIVLRLSLTGGAYRRGAERERAARAASQAMVAAVTPTEVVAATRAALRKVVQADSKADVMLVDEYRAQLPRDSGQSFSLERENPAVPIGAARSGELAIPLPKSDAALIFSAPVDELTELVDLLRLLADQAALALQRIHFADEAAARERERYFRSLVLTSSDVIFICRDGRIEYATPSAQNMFGRNVVGERFDDVVHPARPTELATVEPAAGEWPRAGGRIEATVTRRGREVNVLVDRRDLTGDPSVRGVVTTIRDITAERELQNELEFRASHDELTGLANVRAWTETLSAEQDRRHGPGEGVAAMFIDLDDFKGINDRYGHSVGDEVLTEVARRIRAVLRAQDLAARVGGDEFAVLLRGLSGVEDARAVAQRLAETLARPTVVNSTSIESKASVGLSYSEGAERIRTLVREADSALYAAKDQGKGRWTEYNPEQWASQRKTHNPAA